MPITRVIRTPAPSLVGRPRTLRATSRGEPLAAACGFTVAMCSTSAEYVEPRYRLRAELFQEPLGRKLRPAFGALGAQEVMIPVIVVR